MKSGNGISCLTVTAFEHFGYPLMLDTVKLYEDCMPLNANHASRLRGAQCQ